MVDLTEKQRDVLDFFIQRWERGESLPTHREICAHFGFASPKAAADHINSLKKKGYLMEDLHHSRGVCLTERSMGIPVLGEIQAGLPVSPEQPSEDFLALTSRSFGLTDRRNAFFLRVKGDSMIGRHIFEGDLVLVEKSDKCRHHDVVAALIDNESTLKTLIRQDGRIWLRSENPNYSDLIPGWDLQIQGVARSVIRLLPTM
jgi:repressor LexA